MSIESFTDVLSAVYRDEIDKMLLDTLEACKHRKAERDAWWAKQNRWFKIRYKTKRWLRQYRDSLRYKIANAIYPYPEDY